MTGFIYLTVTILLGALFAGIGVREFLKSSGERINTAEVRDYRVG